MSLFVTERGPCRDIRSQRRVVCILLKTGLEQAVVCSRNVRVITRMATLTARSMRLPLVTHSTFRPSGAAMRSTSVRHYSQLLSSTRRINPIKALTAVNSTLISSRSLFTQKKPRPFYKAFVWSLLAFGATFGVAYHLDSRSAVHRWIAIPVLQTVTDPETAQKLAVKLLASGVMPRDLVSDDEVLAAEVSDPESWRTVYIVQRGRC